MTNQIAAGLFLGILILWVVYEMGWGGAVHKEDSRDFIRGAMNCDVPWIKRN